MSDIDYIADFSTGSFQITLGNNAQAVTGNRALMNRFEVTFMTGRRQFVLNGQAVTDPYGGNAPSFINRPSVLNDIKSIAASVTVAIEQTVECILSDQPVNLAPKEKLQSASLVSIDVVGDVVTASIRVVPVEVEAYDALVFNLPITTV